MERIRTRGDLDRFSMTSIFEDVALSFAFRWNPRAGAWVVDVSDSDGTSLAEGLRLTPGSPLVPDVTLLGLPPGRLFVLGEDPYERDALGEGVQIYYATASEAGVG